MNPSGTDGEVQRPDPTGHLCFPLEDDSASESLGENVYGSVSRGVSSVLSNATSDGEGGGACEARGRAGGLELSRPSSETYLTASDDSSSLFDDDMQRTERPSFSLLGSSDGMLGDCKQGEEEEAHRAKLEDCTSEELNKRFQSQRLDSSSSSSEPNTPSPILMPAVTPKRPNPPQDLKDNPALPKQPRLRIPAGLGLMNVSLAKKHLSQPPISTEAAHGRTRNAFSILRPLQPQETDLDQEQEQEQEVSMERCKDMPAEVPSSSQATPTSWELLPEPETDMRDTEKLFDSSAPGNKPPTPPLHRLPSWVRLPNISCEGKLELL